nr:hypothetical protein [Streptomyces sp. HNM0574]
MFRATGGAAVQSSTPQQNRHGGDASAKTGDAPAAQDGKAAGGGGRPSGDTAPHGEDEHTAAGEGDEAAPAGGRPGGDHAGREERSGKQGTVPGQATGPGGGRGQSGRQSAPGQPTAQNGGTGGANGGANGTRSATAARGAAAKGRQAAGGSTGQARGRRAAARRPSGRERHDEKITVYVSAEELMDLEHARLVLRGEHGLAVDRGRIVREAVAVVLADLESRGDASILVRRLRGR